MASTPDPAIMPGEKQKLADPRLKPGIEEEDTSDRSQPVSLKESRTFDSRDRSSSKDKEADEASEKSGGLKHYFRIFRYTGPSDILLYVLAFTGAISVGASLPLMTLVFGTSTSAFNDFASGIIGPEQFQLTINSLVLYFVYLFIGRFAIGYLATLCICVAATRTTNNLRKAFFNSLLRQEISYFDTKDQGSVAAQVTTNGNRINIGIAEKLYGCAVGIALFFSSFIVALAVQWKLALITMSVVPASILFVGGSLAADAPVEARVVQIHSRAATVAQDALGSIKTIQAFGAQSKVVRWYDDLLQAAHKEGSKKSLIYGVLFSCQTFVVMAGTALAFWQGFRMYQSGEIQDVGTVFTVVLSVTLGATSVMSFLPSVMAITNASSAATELFSIIDRPSQLDPMTDSGDSPSSCEGKLEFRDVHFAYPARLEAPVLQGLNLVLPAGRTTALVGPSGSGKSTIVGLLERWYTHTSGHILLDGQDIADLRTKWVRTTIRTIQQEPTLFRGTIFENIVKGFTTEQSEMSEEKQAILVQEACKAADAHGFIERLPQGYHTQLGERAGMLSGGQRQRLTIARSIVSDPKILLCDEATSALDPRAERAVQDALNKVSRGKTTLIIAHRLSTVMAADHIAVMAKGKVVEQGTHHELIGRDGLYAAMVRAQDLGAGSEDSVAQRQAKSTFCSDLTLEGQTQRPRTRSQNMGTIQPSHELSDEPLSMKCGLDYPLVRCIYIMLKEHAHLYGWYGVLAIAMIAVGGTYPAQAVLFSRLISVFTLQGTEAQSQANFYSLMFLVLAIGNLVGYFFVGIGTNTIGQELTHRYRREMIERIISFDQDFFDHPENNSGALTAKLSSVPSAIQELMSANLGLMLNVIVNILASSITGIVFGWKLGLILVVVGITIIVGSGYVRIRLDQNLESSIEGQFAESASLAAEAIGSIKTVSSLTLESAVLEEYSNVLDSIMAKVVRNLITTLLPYALSQSADFLVMALGFWLGCKWIATGEYTVTQFFVIFLSVIFGGQAGAQFFTYTTSITRATGSSNYLFWLRTVKPSIGETDSNTRKGLRDESASIELQSVDFSYSQRASVPVLKDMSLRIKPGTHAAFVGPSGCGKSTIISLLERFYDPTSGQIRVNDGDISNLSPTLYRRCMSMVQQEPTLFLGSVRDNITLGLDYDPTEQEVEAACQQANALDFVTSLPEGLNTPCGSRGLQFSGGQRQRIAVARALIRKPKLLLLDEATSALDTQSERIVQKALDDAASGRTTIAVAHRLSTIRHADVIFVIQDGRIAEVGTHEELLARRGRYHAMCLAQTLDQQ
ncbi:Sophorolipid transporter-like protein [Elsinoe fawcettii]|nr:Sophorolipid transporter-like protein [Elsinoe fawcettii]